MTGAEKAHADGSVAAVVLAGGCSSRIGRPKALLPLPGGTILSHVTHACSEAGIAVVHVVIGHRGGEIAAHLAQARAIPIWNDRYPEGQTSSIQAGLRSLASTIQGAVLFPVDYPLVGSDVIRALVAAFCEGGESKIFLPVYEGRRGHPLLVDRSIDREFLALSPSMPGRTVVHADPGRIREVPVQSDTVLIDVDTPADFALVRARLRESKKSAFWG